MTYSETIHGPQTFLKAVHSNSPTEGYTHTFYKYPARFSPQFVRAAIQVFSEPGDVVLDPFMGSGTTLVEALVAGRHAIGSDISSLAYFVSNVKTTFLEGDDYLQILEWLSCAHSMLGWKSLIEERDNWIEEGYLRYIPTHLAELLNILVSNVSRLKTQAQRNFVRCALLSTAQRALDSTKIFPSVEQFKIALNEAMFAQIEGLEQTNAAVRSLGEKREPKIICLNMPAADLTHDLWKRNVPRKPSLVITSPPYPSVHVLYHRWQVNGRRETPAPFWIAGERDGNGEAFYTMGSRTPTGLNKYFRTIEESFARMYDILDDEGVIVQLIAFSKIDSQLPLYLAAMQAAGFEEIQWGSDERVWRQVPSRKWHATLKGLTSSSKELLLVHKRVS